MGLFCADRALLSCRGKGRMARGQRGLGDPQWVVYVAGRLFRGPISSLPALSTWPAGCGGGAGCVALQLRHAPDGPVPNQV
jgi:hypothetical protein